MIQGNYKDQWENDEFEKLRSIVNKIEEENSMVETYNRCFNTEVEIELIDLDNQEIINCCEIKNAKDEISSLRKTIENMKRSIPNEQMIDQIIIKR